MKFLIKTKQIVLNQTWLVKGFSLICMRGRRGFAECPVWLLAVIPTSWKFLILTAYAQQTLHNLCFDLRKKGISVRLSTLSFIICLHLFSLVFLYGRMCCIWNPQTNVCCPWEVLLPCSHEFFPKYCQELLGGQIIPLREVRHTLFFPSAFVIQRCSCLMSGSCVYIPLKAERCLWVVKVYVQVCLFFMSPRQSLILRANKEHFCRLMTSISAG